MLSLLFVGVIFFGGVAASVRWPYFVVCLAVFLAPWEGIAVDVGVRITAYRIVITGFVLATAMGFALRGSGRRLSVVGMLGVVIAGYVMLTTMLQLPLLPGSDAADGMALRFGWYRSALQTFSFISDLGLVYAVSRVVAAHGGLWRLGRLYVESCLVLATLGWFQLAGWYAIGWNPLPIDVVVSAFKTLVDYEPHVGIAFHEGVALYRMNSLGWEPRNLAGSFAVALLLLQSIGIYGAKGRPLFAAWGILFLSMLATLSTSGVILWGVGTLLSWGLALARGFRGSATRLWPAWSLKFAALVCVATMLGVFALSSLGVEGSAALNMLMLRGRAVDHDVFLEDFDEAVVSFLADQPFFGLLGVGLGNVHVYAENYLPPYAQYAFDSAFRAKSGALFLVSELGLLGCVLFTAWYVAAVRRLTRVALLSRGVERLWTASWFGSGVARFGAVMFVLFLLRGHYVGPQLFLTLAAVIALATRIAATGMLRFSFANGPTRVPHPGASRISGWVLG